MSDQATILRGLMERRQARTQPISPPSHVARAQTIAVTSGKGGVGKSNIALNLAIALARLDASVCLLDANMGLGNIDLLCGLNGYWNLSHVISGARTLSEIVLDGPAGVHVIPGASGLADMADCPASVQQDLLRQLEELEQAHDCLVIDTGTGIHRLVRQFVSAADIVLVVTTPEPTSIADAYATIKALSAKEPPRIEALVNRAESASQGRAVMERLQQTTRLFLHAELGAAGCVPDDPHVSIAVRQRQPFQVEAPDCPAAKALEQLARRFRGAAVPAERGPFFPRFWQRLTRVAA